MQKNMQKNVLKVTCGLFLISGLHAQGNDVAVERWDTYEVSFVGGRYANPFRDASLSATFAHESGRTIKLNGFYDGGTTWRIRFMPVELGRWTYVTESTDPVLKGKTGTIICRAPQKPFLHGPIRANGFHFIHADGNRRFLISTRLSCQFANPSAWSGVIDLLKKAQINRVLFMMGGVHGQIKLLYGDNGDDLWSYDVKRFQAIDRFIDALRRADILASPYFYYFNDRDQRQLTPEQDEAFIRYGMARFGAFANVMPVLSNEVEQKSSDRSSSRYDLTSHAWADRFGGLLKSLAVFGVPVAVHNPMETREARSPGFFSLLTQWPFKWADFQLRQMQVGALGAADTLEDHVAEPADPSYNARAFARQNELLIRLRRFGVPVINEEPGYEMEGTRPWNSQSSSTVRQTFWTAAVAGAYAMWGNPATYETNNPLPEMQRSRVPGYMETLARVMESLPYWEMEPMNDLVAPNPEMINGMPYRTNFALAKPGSCYLVYSRVGGAINVKLPPGDYTLVTIRLIGLPAADPAIVQSVSTRIKIENEGYNRELGVGEDQILVFGLVKSS